MKFLSKSFFKIIFLNFKIRYFNRISNEIFNTNNYYNELLYSVERLLKELKFKFDFSNYCFLKYSFEELINSSLISSCLIHLFDCPRTQFARNTCPNCSRIYVKILSNQVILNVYLIFNVFLCLIRLLYQKNVKI